MNEYKYIHSYSMKDNKFFKGELNMKNIIIICSGIGGLFKSLLYYVQPYSYNILYTKSVYFYVYI